MKYYDWHIKSAQNLITVVVIVWCLTCYMRWALPYMKESCSGIQNMDLLWWDISIPFAGGVCCSDQRGNVFPSAMTHFSLSGSICLNHIHEPVVRVCSILWGESTSPTVCPDMRNPSSWVTRELGRESCQIHARSRSICNSYEQQFHFWVDIQQKWVCMSRQNTQSRMFIVLY